MDEFLIRVGKRVSLPPSIVDSVLRVAIDEMGWPEINAFREERTRGQSINEDAGGFFLRFIGCLFGVKPKDEVITYKNAMQAMVKKAKEG